MARRRNHLTSKAKTVPEIHENASIARKARISTAINKKHYRAWVKGIKASFAKKISKLIPVKDLK